jgi:carbamoyl-phosphate synthase large subunit
LIAKPAAGSASIGLARVKNECELRVAAADGDYVVQEIAPGHEHTLDVLVTRKGRALCSVPRKRLEVRGGEVSKAITVRHRPLQDLGMAICERLPGAYGVISVQIFLEEESGELNTIEVNPRFGGGFPLAYEAGADCPGWIIEEICGLPSTILGDGWQDGLVMLRYDDAVFVGAAEVGL